MMRFIHNLAAKCYPQRFELIRGPLAAAELRSAEYRIFASVQAKHYADEIRDLVSAAGKVKRPRLQSLCPLLDSNGIMRVGGRLEKTSTSHTDVHPIILPPDDTVTTLLVLDIHGNVFHCGMERTLAEVRGRFWIPKGRSAVRRIVYHCLTCKHRRSVPQAPRMGNVPECRLQTSRAFCATGIDYFGAMSVKRYRKVDKTYGVLFTCLTTRAVHLELANCLDTDSFLLAFRRFVARRGKPDMVYSDNGSNFIGGEREMRESLAEWEQERIANDLSKKGIQWNFIPPGAPHMGGAWERLVGSVKRALRIIPGSHCLSEEVLHTLLTEIEAMINGRPLTYLSSDGRDLEPLTPNHILLGCACPNTSPGRFVDKEVNSRRRWRQTQTIVDQFWRRWRKEYLPTLFPRQKWHQETRQMKVGDVVLMQEANAPRGFWPLARVQEVYPGSDGRIRSVELVTAAGTTYRRPVTKVCFLEESD